MKVTTHIWEAELADARRATEVAEQRAETNLRTLLDLLPEVVLVHHQGPIAYVNSALLKALGYARADELVGRLALDLVHPEDQELVKVRDEEIVQTQRPTPLRELRLLRRDGAPVVIEILALPIEFQGRQAILVSGRDVSERQQIHARLLQADRMVSVGTLAAGVAHEINNPLAAVIANLEYAADVLPEIIGEARALERRLETQGERSGETGIAYRLDEFEETLQDAREGANRVRLIVRDLKIFSRGNDDQRGPVDVRRILESSINMAWNEIRHRARLVKDYHPVPPIEANEARLGQVFINLLVNAAQSIPEGQADRNEIRVVVRSQEDGQITIEVRDTGSGIPAENLRRIFDPFFTTKPIGVGTGLGLSICQGIIAALGGEIGVESEMGRGSTFRVVLPSCQVQTPTAETAPPIASGRRGRILVVDDEPMIGASIRRALGSAHEVIAVQSASEALAEVARGKAFDVILCDLMMPVMTGMDLYLELQRTAPQLASEMIFLTGGAFTQRAQEFLDRVANQRIEKPFDGQMLRALIHDRLG